MSLQKLFVGQQDSCSGTSSALDPALPSLLQHSSAGQRQRLSSLEHPQTERAGLSSQRPGPHQSWSRLHPNATIDEATSRGGDYGSDSISNVAMQYRMAEVYASQNHHPHKLGIRQRPVAPQAFLDSLWHHNTDIRDSSGIKELHSSRDATGDAFMAHLRTGHSSAPFEMVRGGLAPYYPTPIGYGAAMGTQPLIPPPLLTHHRQVDVFNEQSLKSVVGGMAQPSFDQATTDTAQTNSEQTNGQVDGPGEDTVVFDSSSASDLLSVLDYGGKKMQDSKFYAYVKGYADGVFQIRGKDMIDAEGNTITDWEAAVKERSSSEKQRKQQQGGEEESTLISADGSYAPTIADFNIFDVSDHDAEAAWTAMTEQGLLSSEDAAKVRGLFRDSEPSDTPWPQQLMTAEALQNQIDGHRQESVQMATAGKEAYRRLQEALGLLSSGQVGAAVEILKSITAETATTDSLQASTMANVLIGNIEAESDKDQECVAWCQKALQAASNLDDINARESVLRHCYLSLASSYTNEFDSPNALEQIDHWLDHRSGTAPALKEPFESFEMKLHRITMSLEEASAASEEPSADLHLALGIAYTVAKEHERAVKSFLDAIHIVNSDRRSSSKFEVFASMERSASEQLSILWNKVGATLANCGRSREAIMAYHQGLTLKPNFPRLWVNLAIAHCNLGSYRDALRFYLSALSLAPHASHVWQHIQNLPDITPTERELVANQDLAKLTNLVGAVDEQSLPRPSSDIPPFVDVAKRILSSF